MRSRQRNRMWGLVIAIAVVAAALLAAVAVKLLSGSGGDGAFAYLSDGALMYLENAKSRTKPVQLGADGAVEVLFSPEGDALYFIDEGGRLYRADLTGQPQAREIDSGVVSAQLLEDGRVLYLKPDGADYSFWLHDGQQARQLAEGADGSAYGLDKTQTGLYYEQIDRSDGGQSIDLFRVALDSGQTQQLVSGANQICSEPGAEEPVYLAGENNDLYRSSDGGLPLLDGSETQVLKVVQGGSGPVIYYTAKRTGVYTLYDFVTDEFAQDDAALLRGGKPREPVWEDYKPRSLVQSNAGAVAGYKSWNGFVYGLDETLMADAAGRSLADVVEAYAAQMYRDAMDNYAQAAVAQQRQDLRLELRDQSWTQDTYDLYRYTDGASICLVAGMQDSRIPCDAQAGLFVYRKNEAWKAAELSELEDMDDLLERMDGGSTEWYQYADRAEHPFTLPGPGVPTALCALGWDEATLCLRDEQTGTYALYAYGLERNGLTLRAILTEGAQECSYSLGETSSGAAVLFYFQDGVLYRYSGGKVVQVDSGAAEQPFPLPLAGGRVLYLDGETLCLWDGRSRHELAEGVSAFWSSAAAEGAGPTG